MADVEVMESNKERGGRARNAGGSGGGGTGHSGDTGGWRISFFEGGWVLWLTGLGMVALLATGLVPALQRYAARGPGDGVDIASYGFDLSDLAVERGLVAPAMRYRDMPPRWDHPPVWAGADMVGINGEMYGKYLVTMDQVVGVDIGGEQRAYPVSVLILHNVINDTVGGEPIVVSYNWLTDSPRVWRRGNAETTFGVSGLVYNSNLLLYNAPGIAPAPGKISGGNESSATSEGDTGGNSGGGSLWSQLTGRAISGERVGEQLELVSCQLTLWGLWLKRHPETTVIQPDPGQKDRYKQMKPKGYFAMEEILYPVGEEVEETGWGAKERVIGVEAGGVREVFSLSWLEEEADEEGVWKGLVGGVGVRFEVDRRIHTAWVEPISEGERIEVGHALWFAWHAMWPGDEKRGDMGDQFR